MHLGLHSTEVAFLTHMAIPMGTQKFERPHTITGQCLCGAVHIEIGVPARWAWHDHTRATRIAHGAAYATYVGCWRKRFRIAEGKEDIARYEDKATRTARNFCRCCGAPLFYERAHSPHMVNVPRALFDYRTGREPRYHVGIAELRDWTYAGEPLAPLKGFPGIVWERPGKKKHSRRAAMF
jgi:hypothetical protein